MGLPSDTPESVLAARLVAAASLTLGTNLFIGPERPPDPDSGMPHAAVFVRQYGGSNRTSLGVDSGERVYRLQVLVRGDVDKRPTAVATANTCLDACQRVDPSEAGYIELHSTDAGWIDLGVDDTEHHRLSFNVKLTFSG